MSLVGAGSRLDTPTLLRRGVLALAALGIVGTTVELVFLRHWATAASTIAWPAMAVLGAGWLLLVRRPSPGTVRLVRWLAIAAAIVALVGVGYHVLENLAAGPLDRAYAATWDALPIWQQWFLATTGGVGPAPVLAPGAILQVALALLLATVRHPALDSRG